MVDVPVVRTHDEFRDPHYRHYVEAALDAAEEDRIGGRVSSIAEVAARLRNREAP